MSLSCPRCSSSKVIKKNYGKKIGAGVLGSVGAVGAGFAIRNFMKSAAEVAAEKVVSAIGETAGKAVVAVGTTVGVTVVASSAPIAVAVGVTAGVVGLVAGAFILAGKAGKEAGEFVDETILNNNKCLECGFVFGD
jgi:hypothetical protein